MDAVGYFRVSTAGQANEGISLEAQEAKVRAWAELHDRELVAVHTDAGISGARAVTRPALQNAIKQACKLKAPLVVYSLSRLARSTKDAIEISERLGRCGADLISLTEQIDTTSASGRLFFRLMSSLAEFERDLTAERTRAALGYMRRQGRRVSRFPPFGFDLSQDEASIIENAREQQQIGVIRKLREKGQSLRAIAEELGQRSIPTKRGGKWTAKSVRAILIRSREIGS